MQRCFHDRRDSGVLRTISNHLVMEARELEGRAARPSAGVIDSQSVKTAESGGICGFDAGKKVRGRKRHIVTDTPGLMVGLVVHPAGIQDRDGRPRSCDPSAPAGLGCAFDPLPRTGRGRGLTFADGGYAGPKLAGALHRLGDWTLQIVKRSDRAKGFEVPPRRWGG